MDCSRSSTKKHYPATLFVLLAALLPVMFIGCHDVTEPPPHRGGAAGVQAPASAVLSLPIDPGPIVTLSNEYMDPLVSPRANAFMRIPNGIPLTFCWTAKRARDGGEIEAYRYGWDVFELGDPAAWDVDFTPYDGSRICSSTQTFDYRGFHLFALEVIDNAGVSSRMVIAIDIVTGPASFDVMPGTCKNPLNMQRNGTIRTVIPGRIGLEVSEIDASSLLLWVEGNVVEPVKTQARDITSPMINRKPCDCPPANADGIDDLLISFDAADIIRALGPARKDETREIYIHGDLFDGNSFSLKDCVTIVGNPRTGDDPALFSKDAVLAALQKSYDEKNFHLVSKLFDDDFTFFFSEEDYMSGEVPYPHWGREEELTATAKLFSTVIPGDALIAGSVNAKLKHSGLSEGATWGKIKAVFFEGTLDAQATINLLLIYAQGEDNWIEVLPPDQTQYPGEVWYQKGAMYFMTVGVGEVTYFTNGVLQTSFTVRFSETKGAWQLVRWRDGL